MGRTGASRRVSTALRPSSATTFSSPRSDGFSSTISMAFFRTGVSALARPNATDDPTVAPKALITAPWMTPPKRIPDAKARTIPPASKQRVLTKVQPTQNSPALRRGSTVSAISRTWLIWFCRSGFSVMKSRPTALTRAARPPTRRTMAPAATAKAVSVTAVFPSLLMGFPSSSSSGTKPFSNRKFRRDCALRSIPRISPRREFQIPIRAFSISSFSSSSLYARSRVVDDDEGDPPKDPETPSATVPGCVPDRVFVVITNA
mmetsp:Transcript_25724/g.60313  ORF Transcript_25724/g.60313 Transcript_25724/m.60313 type:complete len:261 (-) Transcript_25724:176-958(-)